MKANRLGRLVVAVAILGGIYSVRAAPLGTGFTYQGQLKEGGSPPSGLYDLRFRLFDAGAGGAQVGAALCTNNVSVTNGLFTVPLDFGAQFAGEQRFLEIEVRADTGLSCGNLAGFVILVPRQALTAAPYALGLRLPLAQTTATNGDVFNITTTGAGDGFQFTISNPASPGEALEGRTDGTGDSVQGINTGTGRAGLFQIINAANSAPALYATTNGSGPALAADGKVGIGTTAPAERLHIVGGTDTEPAGGGFLVLGSTTSTNISIDNNEIMARNNGATETLALNADGGNITLIQSGAGNVGIGTTNPNHELVVQGNDPTMQIRDDATDNSANAARLELLERAGGNFDGGAFFWWNGETNKLLVGTKVDGVNTNVLVIDRATNSVGIGTQTPGNFRLAVNGPIRAKEIVVETGWSDFVFDPDYELRSLEQVEAHIREHGHLPDIPSAGEVYEHGVKVGEMQSKLLQKVEELTLHLIEMNKRVQSLERENARLSSGSNQRASQYGSVK